MKKSTKFNVDVQNYSIQFQKIDENNSRYFIEIYNKFLNWIQGEFDLFQIDDLYYCS